MLRGHGGGCCGINYMSGFGLATTADEIRALLAQTRQQQTRGILVEAVVTNGQLQAYPNVGRALKETGFNLATRFQNPHSSNICNVFHYNRVPRKFARTFGGIDRDMVGGGL